MVEKELELDGSRTLSLVGDEYLVTYTDRGEFVVIERNLFNSSNKCYKLFKGNENLAQDIDNYVLAMGFENKSVIKELENFIDNVNKIVKNKCPINTHTVGKVKAKDIKILGTFDLGIGEIVCYSDGNVELKYEGISTLGNIVELEKSSVEVSRDLVRDGNVVSNNISISDIVKGIRELNELYLKYHETPQEPIKPKETADANTVNKSRELALCVIVTEVVKMLANGRSLLSRYRTTKEVYDQLYIALYDSWINSGEQFSIAFFRKELDKHYLKPVEATNKKEIAMV